MSNLYSIGQMNQLGDAFEAEGFTPDDVTKLKQFGNLAGIKGVLEGSAKIKPVAEDATRVITIDQTTIAVNLGATPKLPFGGVEVEQHIGEGWAIVGKRADGLYVNGRKVVLYLSNRQMDGRIIQGCKLREELTGKFVLNANILDALYDNQYLIPKDWKKDKDGDTRYIFFWATIYRHAYSRPCVRYLYFASGAWSRLYDWLDDDWRGSYHAAL